MFKPVVPILAILLASASFALAEEIDFVRDVRPILQQHCYSCHGAEKQKSGLRLDIKSEAFKGGEAFGRSIVAGKASDSPLVKFVAHDDADLRMPPDGKRLSASEVAMLTRWVDQGAIWPEGVDLAQLADKRDHWSFRPVARQTPPATTETTWPQNSIDRFVQHRLEREGLHPAPPADRLTWLRRVTFDLTGLPPTPEQVKAFLDDQRPEAFEHVVDELLASPRYGERWAQHWLDLVRYADTHGFEVNTERPHAWPYRDYVITAFNRDTPYDQFIREQLAGDALGQDAATGFLVTASVLLPGQIGADDASKRLARQDSLDEIVVNIGQTFLGLSVGCARCHDHKFDPITSRDYYSMQAFVAGVEYGDRDLLTAEAEQLRRKNKEIKAHIAEIDAQLTLLVPLANSGAERTAVNARVNSDRFAPVAARRLRFTITATNNLEPCLDELEVFDTSGVNVALAASGTTATSSGNTTVANLHELQFVNDGVYGNQRSWLSNETGKGWVELEFPREVQIERVIWGRDRTGKLNDRLAQQYQLEVVCADGTRQVVASSSDRRKFDPQDKKPAAFSTKGLSDDEARQAAALRKKKSALEAGLAKTDAGQKAFAGTFRKPDEIHLLYRGDPEQPKEKVAPAVLSSFGDIKLADQAAEQQRRLALANWLANPQHPLTARVMVNRIWQGHFGMGIVETASDFGRSGLKPSHPELLDWLAGEFVDGGWSVKRLHRLIVLSATYRQSSELNPIANEKDADVRWLWRFPSRRLEAEAIRDSMLAVSGRLNLKMGGRGFDLFDKRGGLTGFAPVETFQAEGVRRMIYAHKVRRERDGVFGVFDCPDAGQSTGRRRESTTPIQALNLFNSRFAIDEAAAFAARVKADVGDDNVQQIRRAYQLALARQPNESEIEGAVQPVREFGLPVLCRALFNCNEFLFLP